MQVTKAIRKYLAGYAEPEARIALQWHQPFAHAVVIPAYGEGDGLLATLRSVPPGPRGRVLIVVVINEPPGAPYAYAEANRQTLRSLESAYGSPVVLCASMRFYETPGSLVVAIDRTGPRAIPAHQGVGLARKIGFDFALAAAVNTQSDPPWLHGTDADAQLPADYFLATEQGQGAVALVRPFTHLADANAGAAVHAYEASLRYYVLGLWHGQSPYAFHTIGSLVSMTPHGYAAVRGVPKRNGAEDFYLLNKAKKTGSVRTLTSAPVVLSGRASSRVPFGTGPAVERIAKQSDPWTFPTYHPAIFDHLREHLLNGANLDAKQTLKFVHALRDSTYPNLPLRDAVREAPFVPIGIPEDLADLCQQLAQLEHAESTSGTASATSRAKMPRSVFAACPPASA